LSQQVLLLKLLLWLSQMPLLLLLLPAPLLPQNQTTAAPPNHLQGAQCKEVTALLIAMVQLMSARQHISLAEWACGQLQLDELCLQLP
jgi:hypothetical protein